MEAAMGMLDKIFKKDERPATTEQVQAATDVPPCPHTTLTPRWDAVDDMGKMDRVTRFICESCHAELTPAEAEAVHVPEHN
jgi:hypothetical protein